MFKSKSTRARAAPATTATDATTTNGTAGAAPVAPAPARRRWLKGYHGANEAKHVGGLKTTLNDPNATSAERDQAKTQLQAMGRGREAHVPMSVKVKSMFRSNKRTPAATANNAQV